MNVRMLSELAQESVMTFMYSRNATEKAKALEANPLMRTSFTKL